MADAGANKNWDTYRECLRIQGDLDLEAWDVMLFQPLQDLAAWWGRQSDFTKAWTKWLSATGGAAFAPFIAKITKLASAEQGVMFSQAIMAVGVGAALGTLLDVAGRCKDS